MIGKAGLAAVALIAAVVGGRSIDLRALYDEMYPVNTLKRDAFNLCHQSDPTFIRALQDDRESCFDRMPHSIALAIGRVRPNSALAQLFSPSGRPPDQGLFSPTGETGSWADAYRRRAIGPRAATATPCGGVAPGLIAPGLTASGLAAAPAGAIDTATALEMLGVGGRKPGGTALADLGLVLGDRRTALARDPIPSLDGRLGTAPALAAPNFGANPSRDVNRAQVMALLDTVMATDLGDAPASPGSGCSAPI